MFLTIPLVRAALQIALLGAITPNVRLVTVNFKENNIDIYFYYDRAPSEEEEELSEVVSTEVMCAFQEMPSTCIHRRVLSFPQRFPQDNDKMWIYQRWEEEPSEIGV